MPITKLITVFIQEHSGNFNYEEKFLTRKQAEKVIGDFIHRKGYWVDKSKTVWVPWHRVDFVRFDEDE